MTNPQPHLERNLEARMGRRHSEHDTPHVRDSEPAQPTPRCDRTRDMFAEDAA